MSSENKRAKGPVIASLVSCVVLIGGGFLVYSSQRKDNAAPSRLAFNTPDGPAPAVPSGSPAEVVAQPPATLPARALALVSAEPLKCSKRMPRPLVPKYEALRLSGYGFGVDMQIDHTTENFDAAVTDEGISGRVRLVKKFKGATYSATGNGKLVAGVFGIPEIMTKGHFFGTTANLKTFTFVERTEHNGHPVCHYRLSASTSGEYDADSFVYDAYLNSARLTEVSHIDLLKDGESVAVINIDSAAMEPFSVVAP